MRQSLWENGKNESGPRTLCLSVWPALSEAVDAQGPEGSAATFLTIRCLGRREWHSQGHRSTPSSTQLSSAHIIPSPHQSTASQWQREKTPVKQCRAAQACLLTSLSAKSTRTVLHRVRTQTGAVTKTKLTHAAKLCSVQVRKDAEKSWVCLWAASYNRSVQTAEKQEQKPRWDRLAQVLLSFAPLFYSLFPSLCVSSAVPGDQTYSADRSEGAVLRANDHCPQKKKEEDVEFALFVAWNENGLKLRRDHNSRAGRIDITKLAWAGWSSTAALSKNERLPRAAADQIKSPTICNKCALLKQDHMDNKLAINRASAHPLNWAHISNWLLI